MLVSLSCDTKAKGGKRMAAVVWTNHQWVLWLRLWKLPKITQFAHKFGVFWTNEVIPKELLAKTFAYHTMVCSVSMENRCKADKWSTKDEVGGLKKIIQQISSIWMWCPQEKSSKALTLDLRDASRSIYSTLKSTCLHRRVAVKKSFLRKGNRKKRPSYAKWQKKWTENQWQQDLWRDESSPEPGAANIQRGALECPSRNLEKYSWRLLWDSSVCESKSKQTVNHITYIFREDNLRLCWLV